MTQPTIVSRSYPNANVVVDTTVLTFDRIDKVIIQTVTTTKVVRTGRIIDQSIDRLEVAPHVAQHLFASLRETLTESNLIGI